MLEAVVLGDPSTVVRAAADDKDGLVLVLRDERAEDGVREDDLVLGNVDAELLGEPLGPLRLERSTCARAQSHRGVQSRVSMEGDGRTAVGDAEERVLLAERVVAGENLEGLLGLRQDVLALLEDAVDVERKGGWVLWRCGRRQRGSAEEGVRLEDDAPEEREREAVAARRVQDRSAGTSLGIVERIAGASAAVRAEREREEQRQGARGATRRRHPPLASALPPEPG